MNIEEQIQSSFHTRHDIPLFYVESGKRLWGMASPDSDFDVLGFHLSAKAYYYDYRKDRDVIEIISRDFVSDDLDKMFSLLAKSNPSILD